MQEPVAWESDVADSDGPAAAAADPDEDDAAPPRRPDRSREPQHLMVELDCIKGTSVQAMGLKLEALNGSVGEVVSRAGDRLRVLFPEPFGYKTIKPENLIKYGFKWWHGESKASSGPTLGTSTSTTRSSAGELARAPTGPA